MRISNVCLIVLALLASGCCSKAELERSTREMEAEMDAGKPSQSASTASQDQGFDVEVIAPKLVKAYISNEISADAKYKGKRLLVSGKANLIRKTMIGTSGYVTLKGPEDSVSEVQCLMTEANLRSAADLSPGQLVTVVGTGAGLMMNVRLDNCRIVKIHTDTLPTNE